MTLKREFIDYIIDIMDSIEKIQEFTKDMECSTFISDLRQTMLWFDVLR